MNSRKTCVAGQFYPADAASLIKAVEDYLELKVDKKKQAIAVIVPHAGYMYSGHVAGTAYASVVVPDDIILLGPNHTGYGASAAVMTEGEWETPIGTIDVNAGLAYGLIQASPLFESDTSAHLGEHSLEVQLPFLLTVNPKITITPVTIKSASIDECREMGKAVAGVVKASKGEVLIVVSSDMNHYESEKVTIKKDKLAIDKILSLDSEGLLDVAMENDITMCGIIPAVVAIEASRELGASSGSLISHSTSADASGDTKQVVGYAAISIS